MTPLESLKAALTAMETASADWTNSIAAVKGVIKELEAVPPPPVEEPPKEEPKPPPVEEPKTSFLKGINAGYWGASELADLKPMQVVRLDKPPSTAPWSANSKVIYLYHGDTGGYNKSGVKAINVENWVKDAVAKMAANPDMWAFEVLNEPGGDWFWGSGANSAENAAAYCKLLKALHAALPAKHPLILASFDGGHSGDNTWGKEMLKADPNVVEYVDGFTEHPYDGSSANPGSYTVRWGAVEEAHKLTGKPIAITEYGRPTKTTTGDSPKSTETQQAEAVSAMVKKARSSGFCSCVAIYGYREGSSDTTGYALVRLDDTKKPGWTALLNA